MLKRPAALLLTVLYFVTTMGFAVNLHFCGDYLASVKVDAPVKNCMPRCAGKMKCCKNKHVEVKVTDSHQVTSQLFLFKILVVQLPKLVHHNYFMAARPGLSVLIFDSEPPDLPTGRTAAFIKNCIFRI
jgi:hypothetical protein